jgi:hypothetical protein
LVGGVGHYVPVLLLVPADVLRPRCADEHFMVEVCAARGIGLDVALVDHGALARSGDVDKAVAGVPGGGEAAYRGWMLRGSC